MVKTMSKEEFESTHGIDYIPLGKEVGLGRKIKDKSKKAAELKFANFCKSELNGRVSGNGSVCRFKTDKSVKLILSEGKNEYLAEFEKLENIED